MTRVLSGVLLGAAFLAIIWFTNATVLLFVALGVGALAFHEYASLAQAIGIELRRTPALVATLAATVVVPFPQVVVEGVLGISLLMIAIAAMTRVRVSNFAAAFQTTAASMLAPVYIGLSLGTLVAVYVFGGRGAVLLLMATIVVSDTAQYYAGRLLGHRPLAPALSPKKTIEGAIGGFVVAPIFLVVAAYYLLPAATNQLALAGIGLALVAAGIAGDLFESTLKRAAGQKDSSALIPGHGGVLDRIDALLFASPIFYLFVRSVFGA